MNSDIIIIGLSVGLFFICLFSGAGLMFAICVIATEVAEWIKRQP